MNKPVIVNNNICKHNNVYNNVSKFYLGFCITMCSFAYNKVHRPFSFQIPSGLLLNLNEMNTAS